MSARRARWWVLLAIGVGAVAFIAFPSRERNVRSVLTRVTETIKQKPDEDAASRRARLERELAPLLASDLRVDIPGLGIAPGRASAIERLLALTDGRAPVIELEHVEIRFEREQAASARFDAIVSDSQAGDLHADARRVRAELEKRGSDWVISSVSATPDQRAAPEARP